MEILPQPILKQMEDSFIQQSFLAPIIYQAMFRPKANEQNRLGHAQLQLKCREAADIT